ncbi:MAG: tetratricopeptide repeat protein, partial [Acidobacteria bacterium]|nr:tetratricopeptide repeat protein [Acidobacteriota bacterium]
MHTRGRKILLALLLSSLHILVKASPLPLPQSSPGASQTQTLYDRLELAGSLIAQQQLARAEAELGAVLRARPRDPNALNLLGVVRAQQRRRREAEQLFLRAIKESPSLVGAYVNLGQLYVEAERKDRALWAFGQAANLAPERRDINYSLAALYEERRNYARALDHLERIPRAAANAEHLYMMVKCYLNLGRSAEAVALTAPLKMPGTVSAEDAASIAAVFATFGFLNHALGILEAARRESPDSFALLYNLGAVYSQKNELEHAAEFYESALKTKSDHLTTLLALAKLWRARGDLSKSFSFLTRARRIAPDSPTVLYDYGWTALNLDQFSDALSALEQLSQKYPREPSYLYTLAVARFYHN